VKKLLKLALFVGATVAVVRFIALRQLDEFRGMSEFEARARLNTKMPDRIPEPQRAEAIDRIVTKLDEKGVLSHPEA
jgi:hypothetical protein